METTARSDDSTTAASYLQHMEWLTAELEVAFNALVHNDISSIESSRVRQEHLAMTALYQLGLLSSIKDSSTDVLSGNRTEMLAAVRRLRVASMKYDALLKYCSRSTALMVSLCNSQSGYFKEDRAARSIMPTWSCEM